MLKDKNSKAAEEIAVLLEKLLFSPLYMEFPRSYVDKFRKYNFFHDIYLISFLFALANLISKEYAHTVSESRDNVPSSVLLILSGNDLSLANNALCLFNENPTSKQRESGIEHALILHGVKIKRINIDHSHPVVVSSRTLAKSMDASSAALGFEHDPTASLVSAILTTTFLDHIKGNYLSNHKT